jgi:heme/copper-type cytochrome/quinol oxidase subunit 4
VLQSQSQLVLVVQVAQLQQLVQLVEQLHLDRYLP